MQIRTRVCAYVHVWVREDDRASCAVDARVCNIGVWEGIGWGSWLSSCCTCRMFFSSPAAPRPTRAAWCTPAPLLPTPTRARTQTHLDVLGQLACRRRGHGRRIKRAPAVAGKVDLVVGVGIGGAAVPGACKVRRTRVQGWCVTDSQRWAPPPSPLAPDVRGMWKTCEICIGSLTTVQAALVFHDAGLVHRLAR